MENNEVQGQQQLFYTEEEVQAKISAVVANLTDVHEREITWKLRNAQNNAQENALEACKNMLDEVDEDSMLSIYNTIADAVGWDKINAFTKLFTVTVMHNGNEVAMFQDVEAEDEDNACDTVLENMLIDYATLNLAITYGNNTERGEVELDTWDISDDFSAEATEQ